MQYLGGKSRIAKQIAVHLTSHHAARYVEPFVGGGAVLTKVAREFDSVIAADVMPDLIEMYRSIQLGWLPPDSITESQYGALRTEGSSPLRTFAGFGASFGGKWWGGYARNGRGDNYAQQTRNSLMRSVKAGMFDPHIEFQTSSVFALELPADLSGTVIYCDPPYAGTTGYRETDSFDNAAAWELYHLWAARGAHVYVSEYVGPDELLIDEFAPQASLRAASSARTVERLFCIPAAGS